MVDALPDAEAEDVPGLLLPDLDPVNALPPLTPYQIMRCGAIALLPYHRPGDPAIADAIRALGGKHNAILLANHGPVVSASSFEAAVSAAEELEESAKLYILLRNASPRLLTSAQVEDLVTTFSLPPLPTAC